MTKLTSQEVAALQLQIKQLNQIHSCLLDFHNFIKNPYNYDIDINKIIISTKNLESHLETLQNLLNEQ
jgi:hypothetical protein